MRDNDDDYTWLDQLQDLGAWLLVNGFLALMIALVVYLIG